MIIQVSAQDARNKFSEILNTAVFGKKNIVITRFDKPQAVLMDFAEYERLTNPRKRYSSKEWDKGFQAFDRIRARNKNKQSKKIAKAIDEAVMKVRNEKRVSGGR